MGKASGTSGRGAKGSHGTVSTKPAASGGYTPKGYSAEQVAEMIKKQGGTIDDMQTWNAFDDLTQQDKDKVLEIMEFTGMRDNDHYDAGMFSVLTRTDKKDLFGYIDDATYNNHPQEMEDFNHYVIKYTGEKPIYTADLTEPTRMKRGNVEWAAGGGGLAVERYYVANNTAKANMMKYMNLTEYKKGKKQ